MNPFKCKYIVASRKQQPPLHLGGLLLGDRALKQVYTYHYLGVPVTCTYLKRAHSTNLYQNSKTCRNVIQTVINLGCGHIEMPLHYMH